MDIADGLFCTESMPGSPWNDDENFICDSDEESDEKHGFVPLFDDDALACLLGKELSNVPEAGYSTVLISANVCAARSNAVQWIIKVCNKYEFRPLTVSLSVNYFDRYLSKHLSKSWKAWMIQLVSVACLSVGAKMEEIDVPLLLDLQVEGIEHIFEARTIQRMELALLSSLEWRMSSVTVFSYVDNLFLRLGMSRRLHKLLFIRVAELVFGTYLEADFLEFRPSTVAMTTIRRALEELAPVHAEAYIDVMLKLLPVEKENMNRCYRLLEELIADPVGPLQSSSQVFGASKSPSSPVTVAELSQKRNECPEAGTHLTNSCLKRPQICQNNLSTSCSKLKKRKSGGAQK